MGRDMGRFAAAVAALVFLGLSAANAATITWTFDSAWIAGSFGYDADTNTYSSVAFWALGDSYDSVHGSSSASGLGAHGDFFGDTIALSFAGPLTNAGGTVAFSGAADLWGAHWVYIPVSGSLVANVANGLVPEPAAWMLMIAAFGALGAARRRAMRARAEGASRL